MTARTVTVPGPSSLGPGAGTKRRGGYLYRANGEITCLRCGSRVDPDFQHRHDNFHDAINDAVRSQA